MPQVSLADKLDIVAQDASLGGASAAVASDTGASTTNGFAMDSRPIFICRAASGVYRRF